MWSSFAMALAVGAVFLYLPGSLALRALRLSWAESVACAPVLGVAAYAVVCVVFEKAGIACSWLSVPLPVIVLSFAAVIVSVLFSRRKGSESGLRAFFGGRTEVRPLALLCLYFVVGVAFTTFVFIKGLDGSESFVQELDNAHHLNAIKSFLDSGVWSSLSSSLYLADSAGVDPTPGTGFYPSAWHDVAALIASATGVSVAQAVNAANTLFVGLVFPGCSFVLARRLFGDDGAALACGAVAMMSFAAFPWKVLYWGPLYPNCASLCVFPAVAWLFTEATGRDGSTTRRVVTAMLFVVGIAAEGLLQPNAVFTTALFLVLWCVHRIVQEVGASARFAGRQAIWQVVFGAGFVAFAALVWAALVNLPALQSVVTHTWDKFATEPQALTNLLTLSFAGTMAQVVLGLIVLAGFLIALRRPEHRWIAVSYALACAIYFVSATTNEPIKHWLAGFWYTDSVRLAANAVLFGMPLATIGLRCLVGKVGVSLQARPSGLLRRRPQWAPGVTAALVLCAFAFINFYPSHTIAGRGEVETAFGNVQESMAWEYGATNVDVLAPLEERFVERCKEAIPEGSVVLNQPNDGSVFIYALDDVHVVYRRMRDYGGPSETAGSKLVREQLDEFATNEDVRSAVRETGAQYLLQLDNPAYTDYPLGLQEPAIDPGKQDYENDPDKENRPRDLNDYRVAGGDDTFYNIITYHPDEWAGIDSVNDETPGFEIVLSQGDMRLYRIVY